MDKNNNDLFELMTKMYSEMQELKTEVKGIKTDVKNLDVKIDKGFDSVNNRIDNLFTDLGKMVTNEVADELSDQLKIIKSDVKFVKHKVQETEEDVFTIQSHLKIIK